MDDVAAFLAACLDEDEARARRVQAVLDDGWNYFGEVPAELIDPARLMPRDVRIRRQIAGLHKPVLIDYLTADGDERSSRECSECDNGGTSDTWPCRTILLLASFYSDRPGWKQEWEPSGIR